MRTSHRGGGHVWALGLAGFAFLVGTSCETPSVSVQAPREEALVVGPDFAVVARASRGLDLTSAAVRVDGVDLVAALGLAPPFSGAAGTVAVGSDLVVVSGFDVVPSSGPHRIALTIAGLSGGAHEIEVSVFDPQAGAPRFSRVGFERVDALVEALPAVTSAGLPGGPQVVEGGFWVGGALGQGVASAPLASGDGGSIRSGHVEAAVQRSTGGP